MPTEMQAQRKIILITVAIVLTLAITSILSTWWTLHRMRSAIASRDYNAFSSYVDYASLHASFKGQMLASGSTKHDSESILGALSEGIIGTLTGTALDVVLGAPGVIEMINQGAPKITRAVISSAITKVPSAEAPPADLKATYRGWNRVAFRGLGAAEEEGSFILIRTSPWTWKLAEVELPEK